jgi:hypothetical protein
MANNKQATRVRNAASLLRVFGWLALVGSALVAISLMGEFDFFWAWIVAGVVQLFLLLAIATFGDGIAALLERP